MKIKSILLLSVLVSSADARRKRIRLANELEDLTESIPEFDRRRILHGYEKEITVYQKGDRAFDEARQRIKERYENGFTKASPNQDLIENDVDVSHDGSRELEPLMSMTDAPTSAPTSVCTPKPVRDHPFCVNDKSFVSKRKKGKKCAWFAKKPTERCLKDRAARVFCAAACNPRCIKCQDNPDYKYNDKERKTCKWVAKDPKKRCSLDPEELQCGCPDTCIPICKKKCSDSALYLQNGMEKRTCDYIALNPEKRCDKFDKEAWFGCPETCDPKCGKRGCTNSKDYLFKGKRKKDCDWVASKKKRKKRKLCKDLEVFTECPAVCDPKCRA